MITLKTKILKKLFALFLVLSFILMVSFIMIFLEISNLVIGIVISLIIYSCINFFFINSDK